MPTPSFALSRKLASFTKTPLRGGFVELLFKKINVNVITNAIRINPRIIINNLFLRIALIILILKLKIDTK